MPATPRDDGAKLRLEHMNKLNNRIGLVFDASQLAETWCALSFWFGLVMLSVKKEFACVQSQSR